MKPSLLRLLAISFVVMVAAGAASAQTAFEMWLETTAVAGPLESLNQNYQPTDCIFKGTLNYPVLHPSPMNSNGTPAECFQLYSDRLSSSHATNVTTSPPLTTYSTGNIEGDAGGDLDSQGIQIPLQVGATIDSVPHPGTFAEYTSSLNYYGENIACNCPQGSSISLSFNTFANSAEQSGSSGQTSILIITASDGGSGGTIDRQTDSFTLTDGDSTVSTTPLAIGPSGTYSIFITVSAAQVNPGDAAAGIIAPQKVTIGDEETFDPPDSDFTDSRGIKFNQVEPTVIMGNPVGSYTVSSGATEGFQVLPDGTMSAPIVEPNDTLHFTELTGINNAGTIVGTFENTTTPGTSTPADTFHGFFLSPNGTYSTFDIGQPGVSTGVQAINNNGDITGDFGSAAQVTQGFLLPNGGTAVTFGMTGLNTFPQAMNDSDTVVGYYEDATGNFHGFEWTPALGLTSFDYPGAVSTHPEGINNAGAIDGYFTDSAGKNHGFFGTIGLFAEYNLAGAANTFGRGINDGGVITGGYSTTKKGMVHGFVVQLCAASAASSVSVTEGAVENVSKTSEYKQSVTLTNTSNTAITGPLYLLLNDLPAGVFTTNAKGTSRCIAPLTPYVTANPAGGSLAAGASTSVEIHFADPGNAMITYTPNVLSGTQKP